MKSLIIIFLCFFTYSYVNAQADVFKNFKVEVDDNQDDANINNATGKQLTKLMLEKKRFVLEADYVSSPASVRQSVFSNLNFIRVDSSNCVIQLGGNDGMGFNGVGGVTIEGTVSKYEMNVDKNSDYSVRISMSSSNGFFDISMYVSQTGEAEALVRGNFRGSVTFYGKLVLPAKSNVYKGNSY